MAPDHKVLASVLGRDKRFSGLAIMRYRRLTFSV